MTDPRSWRPNQQSAALIEAAHAVIASADQLGLRFTLRRVYYELVSANLIPNTIASYRKLSTTLNRARWAGYLPLDCLDDLGRVTQSIATWQSTKHWLASSAATYRTDPWRYADTRVELWAEKAAVQSILAPIANRYTVPLLTLRGYSSLTALAEALHRHQRHRHTMVLYLGDHDPSGQDMDRDLAHRLELLGSPTTITRVALTRDQIEEHALPPQPTKRSDPRAWRYNDDDSWELDALPAQTLTQIVEDAIAPLLPDNFEQIGEQDAAGRQQLYNLAANL